MEFDIRTTRRDAHGSEARCKSAKIILDTGMQGRDDAFNPAELLLAALSACIIKGIERIASIPMNLIGGWNFCTRTSANTAPCTTPLLPERICGGQSGEPEYAANPGIKMSVLR